MSLDGPSNNKRNRNEESSAENPIKKLKVDGMAKAAICPFEFSGGQLKDQFLTVLFKNLSNQDLGSFSQTCKTAHAWTEVSRRKRWLEKQNELLAAIVQGNQAEAERLIKLDPSFLLSNQGEATDYSGRKFTKLTPFQAALCTLDDDMCTMMKGYFDKIDDGQAKMQIQLNEIFPEGLDAHVQSQQDEAYNFDRILQAIIDAPDAEVTAALEKEFHKIDLSLIKALNQFRNEFQEKSLSKAVFNPYHILKAYETYNNNFGNLESWDKRDLFWRQVVGYTQRLASDVFKQALAQGIYYIVKHAEALRRTFNFGFGDVSILGAGLHNFSGVGFDYAARSGGASARFLPACGALLGVMLFQSLCETKHQAYRNYAAPAGQALDSMRNSLK